MARRISEDYERIIFREEYDPYREDMGYLAIFPDDEANLGRVGCIAFHKGGYYGGWVYEPYTEADYYYLMKQKIIHKNDPRIPELVKAIEDMYDIKVKVVEKINR